MADALQLPIAERLQAAVHAMRGIKLPQLPDDLMKLQQMLKSRLVNSYDVAAIIDKDTTLSGEVLTLINSPVTKIQVEVRSIREAVEILGLDNIRNLLISAVLKRLFGNDTLYQDIMEHSVDVAFCMADLSEWVQGVERDEAYMLGLFHNGGALMLATKDPQGYLKLFSQSHSLPLDVIAKEQAKYGTDHATVGVLLGKRWHLPLDMLSAILLHHVPECASIQNPKVRAYVALIKVANAIVSEISFGGYRGDQMKAYEKDGQKELMISDAIIREIRLALMAYTVKD
jgi:HD-like signal output (HDOD) protein